MEEIAGKRGGGFVPAQPNPGTQVSHRVVGRYFFGAGDYEAAMKERGWKRLRAEPGEMTDGGLRWWTYVWSYMPDEAAAEERRERRIGLLVGVPILVIVAVVVGLWVSSADFGDHVSVAGHSCAENPDGSVHVQGELRNNGGSDEIAIVEFSVTFSGGQKETSKPFGGYNVPAERTSLVGHDFNVPTGATWVGCSVEVLG